MADIIDLDSRRPARTIYVDSWTEYYGLAVSNAMCRSLDNYIRSQRFRRSTGNSLIPIVPDPSTPKAGPQARSTE